MSGDALNKLAIVETIKEGFVIGTKNIGPVLVNVLLWILTCWIPYLNVGTTIGLYVGIISKASKGEMISFTEIFDPKYRKYMGEYFLTTGLMMAGIAVGTAFLIIPGIVVCLSWSLSLLLVIDKGKNPAEALTISNNCTYGNKWRMVGVYILVSLVFGIGGGILLGIVSLAKVTILSVIVGLAVYLFCVFVMIGIQASIYKRLTANVR